MALLFDSHCHLDDEQFDSDRESLLLGLQAQGIANCLCVGSDIQSSEACLAIAEQHPFIFAACGIHPHVAGKAVNEDFVKLVNLLKYPKAVALGEAGLDYHYDFSPRDIQKSVLERQIEIAEQAHLPIVLHVREAHGDMISLLRARKSRDNPGIIHCFSGSAESAVEYVKMGYMISFSGSISFKNAEKLRLAALAVPRDRLLIETDSPYLSPMPDRGRRNDPSKVRLVCESLAKVCGISFETMAELTLNNARQVFSLK